MHFLTGFFGARLELNVPQAGIIFLALSLLFCLCRSIYQLFFSPLSRFPGPFWAAITDLWHAKVIWTGKEYLVWEDLHARYGPVVRIGPSKFVTDVLSFRKIYSVTSPFRKNEYYEPYRMPGVTVDIFAEQNEAVHGRYKRQFSNVFSASSVQEVDANIDDTIKKFVAKMRSTGEKNINLGDWFERFLSDCMFDFILGKNLGHIEDGSKDIPYDKVLDWVRACHMHGQVPTMFRAARIWNSISTTLFPHKNDSDETAQCIEEFLRDFKNPENTEWAQNQRSIAAKLLRVQSSKGSESFPDVDVAALADFGIKAGVADGSGWLNSVFYNLINNPDKLSKLMQELEQKAHDGELDMICTSQQAAACPYLNAVLHESLRLHVTGGGIMPRQTPQGGVEIRGHHIPAGVTIGAPSYLIQRLPEIFGPETSSFIPERWLADNHPDMHRFSMQFGMGARVCLGKHLAWVMLRKIVPSLLLNLNFEVSDPKSDWKMVSIAGLHTYDFYAQVRKRGIED